MNRRQLLLGLAGSGILLAAGVKGAAMWRDYSLASVLAEVHRLPLDRLHSTGTWNPSQIFQHCAQSIRYSRIGYPEAKSALFRHTAGAAAVNVFAAAGRMSHPLDEAIPGAPALDAGLPLDIAHAELMAEIEQFLHWPDTPAPHFAYGPLTHRQYTAAHVLHWQNHLHEIRIA